MIKVMIVDDESIILEGLTKVIKWKVLGYEIVSTAINGLDGLKKYDETKPELIITDIQMPKMNGLKMIKHIREKNEFVRFILLTGHKDFEYARKAIQYGVEDYVLKPIDQEALHQMLDILCQKIENEKRMFQQQVEKEKVESTEKEAINKSTFIIEKAERYICENYMKEITLDEVAEHVFVSKWYLSRLFKKERNINFSDYITYIKMKEAKRMIRNNPMMKNYEIADLLGYKDVRYFSQVFKKTFGINPSEYRG